VLHRWTATVRAERHLFATASFYLAILAVVGSAACSAPQAASEGPLVVRLTTGVPGAGFHPLGEALARQYRHAFSDISVVVQESAGSVSNIEAVESATADVGLAFADVAYMAYAGRLHDAAAPFEHLRGMAVLQLTPLHLIARRGAAIAALEDLRGRSVGVGPPGSGTALTASIILEAAGLNAGDVRAESLLFNEAAERVAHGDLDAMFVNGSYPAESIRIAANAGARLVPVEGAHIDRMRHEYPFLRPTIIPGGTYPGHSVSTHTVGIEAVLVCRSDLKEETVYRLTRTFFEVLPAIAAEQESVRLVDLEQAPATPIPLHEGAARFYRERELSR